MVFQEAAPTSRDARRRRTGAILLSALVGLVAWIAITANGGDATLFPGAPAAAKTQIYLIDNGFHTDLALPRPSISGRSESLAKAVEATTGEPWIVVGWGDKQFYTQSGFTAGRLVDGLRSLFMPGNASVVRVEGLPRSPDQIYVRTAVLPITVTTAGLARLETRIDQSLAIGSGGQPVLSSRPGERNTAFFASVEHFSLIHLCNHWTAGLLRAAGLPTTPVIDTIPAGLKLDLKVRAGIANLE